MTGLTTRLPDGRELDLADLFTRFDEGTLEEDELIDLMQWMVDTGYAWSFPGRFGRTAADLIEAGLINPRGI